MKEKPQISSKDIKPKILDNFVEYAKLFTPFQSEFLCGLYKRYQCLDNGSLVLYFAKNTHQAILRKKDYDLNYDLSFEKFWQNHSEVIQSSTTIINIAKIASLPKETTRRKLSELTKQRVLGKKNKHIVWLPSDDYKKNYNDFIAQEIKSIAKLTKYVTDQVALNFTIDEITEEYKKKFSFYWFHYLDTQLKWMRMWKKQFSDLEVALIFLQFASILSSRFLQNKTVPHNKLFNQPQEVINAPALEKVSVSATSVSDVTGIPRATCIRKLKLMAKQKILLQDKNTKRYYIIPEAFNKNLISKDLTDKATEIFSEFYSISIKALNSKNSH